MKTKNLFKGIVLSALIVFNSCTTEEDSIGNITINEGGGSSTSLENKIVLQGDITLNQTLTSDKVYELLGGVSVKNGVTLTIEAGTKIIGGNKGGVIAYLAIEQGAKIMAEGTANEPIVFTSSNATPNPGDWGGLLIAGKAPINRGETASTEVANLTYGGTDAADNSGILKYVRLEYTGGKINDDAEYNGLSLYGVGNGTKIEYIQAFNGNDDGVEFYGGTVDLKYAIVSGAGDDSFDWTDGWAGNGQFWVAQQTTNAGDSGIEADNLKSNNAATPFSNPTLSNITLIGSDDGDGKNRGILFRRGTKAKVYNLIIKGFPKAGIVLNEDQTVTNLNNNELIVQNSIIDNVLPIDTSSPKLTVPVDINLADYVTFNNYSPDATGKAVPSTFEIIGFTGTYELTAAVDDGVDNFDPSTLGSFFTAAKYIGAVKSDDTWSAGWARL